ncbi:hypothetical protein ASPZODRAFT_155311 [Penicilliopsis zonata CBS 506.65]|uniref:Amino acid permease/ SLC12A domain-containing protein n=1 Tax=Penicilliopsis zonata CBS 506.65 TaxID=1073090 RepID=A0A1L9S5E6_9EURO|nr:hypothetical protein ASPZODRAFT_155311 [Penicilliopsis zonata CBS 506.65]OJJ42392.1 hypothetical protein ASPZODRAFT_155311 [Penicilliopsis zonata CBS 506.65]
MTASDHHDELIQGHVRELPSQFSLLSLLAFAFSIMNSWVAFVSLLVTNLTLGGPGLCLWATIVACAAATIIAMGLAELVSAFPSSGGQYHCALMVYPLRYRAAAAFATGWLSVLGYLFTTASSAIFVAESIMGVAEIYYPAFAAQRWQIWCIYALMLILATVAVTVWPSLVPRTQSSFFGASVLGMLVITIAVLAASPTKQSAAVALVNYDNSSGWPSGISFMLATGQSMWSFACVDSATHMAEEIPRPEKNVPLAMLLGMLIGLVTMVGFTLAMLFSATDFDQIATSAAPMYECFIQAFDSPGASLFLTIWVIIVYFGSCVGLITTTGRLIWAFSRDNGLPFSSVFATVNRQLLVPANANIATCVFCLAYGCLYIGSPVAFNTFISTAILFLSLSYTVPQIPLLFHKNRDQCLPPRPFSLGRFLGPFCNLFSIAWVLLYALLFSFPLVIPTTLADMSYVSVVLVASIVFVGSLWFLGGKRSSFTGPLQYMEAVHADLCTITNYKDYYGL